MSSTLATEADKHGVADEVLDSHEDSPIYISSDDEHALRGNDRGHSKSDDKHSCPANIPANMVCAAVSSE